MKKTKLKFLNIIFLLFFPSVLCSGFSQLQESDVIEVNNGIVNFQMRNMCMDGLVLGFTGVPGKHSELLIFDGWNIISLNPVDSNHEITGVSSFNISNYSTLYYTTRDTFYQAEYDVSAGNKNPLEVNSIGIPNIITMKGGSVFAESDSTILIHKVSNMNITNTLQSGLLDLKMLEHGISNQSYNVDYHIIGLNADSVLTYLRFRPLQEAIVSQLIIDTIPGEIVFVNGNIDKSYFISQTENEVYLSEYFKVEDSLSINLFPVNDSIINASLWSLSSNQMMTLSPFTDSLTNTLKTLFRLYDVSDFALIDSFEYKASEGLFAVSPGYEWVTSNSGLIEYAEDSLKYLTSVTESGQFSFSLKYPLSESGISAYDVVTVCFYSIGENDQPVPQFYLYPNPTEDYVNVVVKSLPCDIEHQLKLTDMSGRILLQKSFYAKNDYTIPVKHLSPGMYILNLHISGNDYSRKLIIR